jgi:hypothetical protein
MKRLILSLLAVVVSCGSGAVFADDDPRVFQTAEVQAAETSPGSGIFTTAEGAAWLKRSEDRVDGRIMAKVDKANEPYSIWWVIFNNPDGCIASCGLADLFVDGGVAADVAVFNASGAISAASGALKRNGKPAEGGVINVDLSVIAGESAGNGSQDAFCPFPFCLADFNEGNGLCAEIHIDINEHEFNGDWVQELTNPENPQGFAVFGPTEECADN